MSTTRSRSCLGSDRDQSGPRCSLLGKHNFVAPVSASRFSASSPFLGQAFQHQPGRIPTAGMHPNGCRELGRYFGFGMASEKGLTGLVEPYVIPISAPYRRIADDLTEKIGEGENRTGRNMHPSAESFVLCPTTPHRDRYSLRGATSRLVNQLLSKIARVAIFYSDLQGDNTTQAPPAECISLPPIQPEAASATVVNSVVGNNDFTAVYWDLFLKAFQWPLDSKMSR